MSKLGYGNYAGYGIGCKKKQMEREKTFIVA